MLLVSKLANFHCSSSVTVRQLAILRSIARTDIDTF